MAEKEYIERNALIAEYDRIHVGAPGCARKLIAEAPAADVVEVVRCKDCRHFFHFGRTSVIIGGENVVAGWCQRRVRSDEEFRMTPNDFCSYGESKPASE